MLHLKTFLINKFLWLIQKELLKIVTTVHDCLITRTPNLQDINISLIINVDSHLLSIFVVIGIFIKFIVFGDVFRKNLLKLLSKYKRAKCLLGCTVFESFFAADS